jgi:RNA polymerase sigma-70 factor (ECF subfamily)
MPYEGIFRMTITWSLNISMDDASLPMDEEARLIAASLAGDGDAFTELVRLHQQRVFRLAGRFFRSREDVEDAAQDTFLTAWNRLSTYKRKAPFEHWLTRVCLNCCYGRLRARKPEVTGVEIDSPAPPSDPSTGLDLERLLALLDPRDRFILLMLDGEGWSVGEIADRLNWTRANVKVRAHRARKKMRRIVEQEMKR